MVEVGLGEKLRPDLCDMGAPDLRHCGFQCYSGDRSSRFATGPLATPHQAHAMARPLPGKAKAVWAAKSRCLWRQSPTMFGHHLRLLCTVCWVVDANHSQRPWAFPQWRRGMPSTSKGAGPSHHDQWWMPKALTVFQGRWAFPSWPVVDAQGPHCERRPKAKRNHSANSTGRSRLPLDGKGPFTYRGLLLRDDALWRGH